ncbi:MAG: hypothetical protein JWO58_606 [Chitinophagaceae bacterium]|nr:hypothetical protein [Chitinophagaceae bacterium]
MHQVYFIRFPIPMGIFSEYDLVHIGHRFPRTSFPKQDAGVYSVLRRFVFHGVKADDKKIENVFHEL